jgi:hypothetical protein
MCERDLCYVSGSVCESEWMFHFERVFVEKAG